MPPKRATRRNGGTPKRSTFVNESGYEPIVNQYNQPDLPAIPIGASWNYGAATTTAMPNRINVRPTMNIDQMVESTEARMEIARERTVAAKQKQQQEAQRAKRAPTPDQTQLQQSLDRATEDHHSDRTPTPPVPHSVSTDSSPGAEPPSQRLLSNSPLYPSPLQRRGSRHGSIASSVSRHSSVDNASEASWSLERDINEDDLQRTRPSKYRGEAHGENISAPPRRISGLAIVPEEDESIKSEAGAWNPTAQTPPPDLPPGPPRQSFIRRWLSAIKPQRPPTIPTPVEAPAPEPPRARRRSLFRLLVESADKGPYASLIRAAIWLFLIAGSISFYLAAVKVHQTLYPLEWDLDSSSGMNSSNPEIFRGLRSQMSKMDVKMSSLSSELSSVVSEQALSSALESRPTKAPDVVVHRKPIYKVNFLSTALGAFIDPLNTSPTLGSKLGAPARAVQWLIPDSSDTRVRAPQPPISALTAWQEVGDCWCSASREGSTQLSVQLGRNIVAEELVVEHVPLGASLEPEAAPRTIEVWARFRVNRHTTAAKAKLTPGANPGRGGFFSLFGDATVSPEPPATEVPSSRETGLGGYLIPGIGSLHGLIMDLLRRSNPFEPESAYSDDPILGQNFYRIGKVEYDLHSPDHIQTFKLNTIVDVSTIRVDKVVFRVTSNWGSKHTCIYRFKLHGHI
ncbi:unnamed protein product [Penicillium salamii]|uniref:SUN domain-containing protein n=1 Tax=Penicillium salamii TaxID=1612424 RepID=A0A9W4IUS9_9EURO|nr:unnamed protein product [Penicillium salamii]CAG8021507.1 unnamed protein product [Penicillium salamii]CAG8128873.1 unnamed protein product [Penicillium salamii]CAG8303588.1 unnamed protein product [Penicillium salamii]CAG8322163.1 unnamed protein product [Penicillium salamii]